MHSSQKLFHYPVDVTARGCSEYYQRITNPVDLESLEKANQHFDFKSIQSIQKALQRMFSNCESFNRDSSILNYSTYIKLYFQQRFTDLQRRNTSLRDSYQKDQKGTICGLCSGGCYMLEGQLLHCSGSCLEVIELNKKYYRDKEGQHVWCEACYERLTDVFECEGKEYRKSSLECVMNVHKEKEEWIRCDHCHQSFHTICVLFNNRLYEQDHAFIFHCPQCILDLHENCITERATLYIPSVTGIHEGVN